MVIGTGDRHCRNSFCKGGPKYDGRGVEIKDTETLPPKKKRNMIIGFLRKILRLEEYENKTWCDDRDEERKVNIMGFPQIRSKKHQKRTSHPHNNVFRPLPS